jgi:hypothetical protein
MLCMLGLQVIYLFTLGFRVLGYCPCAATAASAVKLFKVVGKVRLKV